MKITIKDDVQIQNQVNVRDIIRERDGRSIYMIIQYEGSYGYLNLATGRACFNYESLEALRQSNPEDIILDAELVIHGRK